MTEMHGVDVSHWQGNVNFGKFNKDFLIAKCTESTNYRDPKYSRNQSNAYKRNVFFGAYHFARGGNATAEADYFLAHANLHKTDIAVLDWEISHHAPDAWCAEFCQRVKAKLGVPPLVYMNRARKNGSSWAKTRATGAGLWFARYQHKIDSTHPWPLVAMFQYTDRGHAAGVSGGCDLDTFYGDGVTWAAYGVGSGGKNRKPKRTKPAKHKSKDETKTHNSGPNHRPGDVGSGVRGIQRVVGAEIDGVYGNETKQLVAKWQDKHGLEPDGIWGPDTRAAYAKSKKPSKSSRVLKVGSHGADVRDLQGVLNDWYPKLTPLVEDGKYGRKTKARVKYFQKRAGLLKDGVAGPDTLGKLGLA